MPAKAGATSPVQRRRDRSSVVALILAAGALPRSFQPSLLPRDTVDQGIVTGLTVAMVYALGLLVQDAVDVAAGMLVPDGSTENSENTEAKQQLNRSIIVGAGALGAGYGLQRLNPYSEDEQLPRSAARTGGFWLKMVGFSGVLVGAVEKANEYFSKDVETADKRNLLPYMIGIGVSYGLISEYVRTRHNEDHSLRDVFKKSTPLKSAAIGIGLAGALTAIGYTEHYAAGTIDKAVGQYTPNLKRSWLPLGHIVAAGGLAFGITKFIQKTMHNQEQSNTKVEAGFHERPTSPLLSGSEDSLVDWGSVSLQGRRHVATALTRDAIAFVMGGTVKHDPIRIFVGLDSAETEADRVKMALDELKRTGAYDRSVIVVVSPTGTGYVNYIMSESVEYLTRGNVASVTIQYSKRPSPLSLDRVGYGHIQYRMLLNGIKKELLKRPEKKRPRVMLFGESLGAWTSQDALMGEGTDGLEAMNIDRALWIGTPYGSSWKEQVFSNKWLNTDENLIGSFDSYGEVQILPKSVQNKIRYVMLTHYNDPIAQFGIQLLIKQPAWVKDASRRPKGMADTIAYRTPALFVQTLIDMKNALKPVPGDFVASGHDYRADLARFIAFTYNLPATPDQMINIEAALRTNEIQRAERIDEVEPTDSSA